jgi:hypothetical protein
MNEEFFERTDADIVKAARTAVHRMVVTGEALHIDHQYFGDVLRCEVAFLRSYRDVLKAYEAFDVQVKLDKSGYVQNLLEELHIKRDASQELPSARVTKGSSGEAALLGAMREVSPDFVEFSFKSETRSALFAGIQDLTIALKGFAKQHGVGIKVKVAK